VIEAAASRPVYEDGIDVAVIAISSPIGIEALPRDGARELIAAHLEGVGELPAWGPIAIDRAGPEDVDELLGRGCLGVSLPATALTRVGAYNVGPGGELEREPQSSDIELAAR
jgi:hypothetical protein